MMRSGLAGVPNSSADTRPLSPALPGACDAHMHIYEPGYPLQGYAPPQADVNAYRKLQALLGTQRAVVVQPRAYGNDHTVTLGAIQTLGPDRTRGIAVLGPEVDESELQRLHEGGIRGVRLSLHEPNPGSASFSSLAELAEKISPIGWHLQLHWTADQIASHADHLAALRVPLVFDHMARLPAQQPQLHPAFSIVTRLLEDERAWIKLSGPYLVSGSGHTQRYSDLDTLARAWLALVPERIVWGSDWPHVTERGHKPDDAMLFDVLTRWCTDEHTRRRVLVDNPATLYGFNPL